MEELRTITNYPDYWITKEGRIYRKEDDYEVKAYVHDNGYLRVNIRRGSIKKCEYVHKLVLTTFVGPCPSGLECCHEDGNRLNCSLDNLSWGTRKKNLEDKRRHGTQVDPPRHVGIDHPQAKLTEDDVREIRRLGRFMDQFSIARKFLIYQTTVSKICRRAIWSHVE